MDYSDLWKTLSNTAGGIDRTGTTREPTFEEIRAYEAIKRGYITGPDGEQIPVDEYGWYRSGPYKVNVWTNNYVPADEATSAQTVGTEYKRKSDFSPLGVNMNFLRDAVEGVGGFLDKNMQYIIPGLGVAALGYGATLPGVFGASGAGASGLGADLAGLGGLTPEGALEAAGLGGGSTYGGLSGAGTVGVGGAGLTGAGTFAVDQSLALAAVEAVAPTADAASKMSLLEEVLKLAAASGGPKTASNYLAWATLGLTGIATLGAMGRGGQTTSATTTQTPTGPGSNIVPGTDKTAADMTFEEYIDDVFNTSGTGLKERIAADQTALTGYQKSLLDTLSGLDTERLTGTKTAVGPFQEQLQKVLDMEKTGTGYYKPFNYSFGGTPMPSFVPKTSLATMNTALGQGRESASLGTSLVDQLYNAGVGQAQRQYGFQSENLPNKAANLWTGELEKMMKYFNPTGQTETTTGEVPGVPWTTTLLQGLTTGTNLFNSIYNPRSSNAELLNALRLLGQGG